MIFAIFRLMARKRPNWTIRLVRARRVLAVGSGAPAMSSCGVVHRALLSYSGIRCQPGRALAL